jgi:hypothetical protein
MPWIIGGVSALSWSAARDKVRGDLWRKGTTAIPDDVVDRALHASILDIESRRKWQWLENVTSSISSTLTRTMSNLPASCGAFSRSRSSSARTLGPTARARSAREAARDGRQQRGYPSHYALSNGVAFFDCTVPGADAVRADLSGEVPGPARRRGRIAAGHARPASASGPRRREGARRARVSCTTTTRRTATARPSRSTSAAWKTATTSCAAMNAAARSSRTPPLRRGLRARGTALMADTVTTNYADEAGRRRVEQHVGRQAQHDLDTIDGLIKTNADAIAASAACQSRVHRQPDRLPRRAGRQ